MGEAKMITLQNTKEGSKKNFLINKNKIKRVNGKR